MKKSIVHTLFFTLLCCLFISCGSKKKQEITLNIKLPLLSMYTLNDKDCVDSSYFLKKALEKFTAQYSKYDVKANVIVFEQTDYKANIDDCYGTANATDLLFGGYFTISGYIYDGYAIPLDDIITSQIKADFSESTWNQSKGYNGKTYLMPFYALQNIFSYNKDLFRQCGLEKYCYDDNEIHGWSLEDWEIILSTLTKKLPANHYAMPMYAANNQGDTHTMIQLRCMGSNFFNEKGLFNLNTPEGIAALQWIKDNYDKGYYPANCENMEINDCQSLFSNNQLAIYIFNSTFEGFMKDKDIGFVNMPGSTSSGVNSNWISGFMAFDNGDAKKVEVLKDFLKFIYESPDLLAYSTAGVPCSKSVAEKYGDKIFMARQFLENEKNTVDFTANNPNWSNVRAAFWPHIHALLTGEETAEQAAKGLDKDCNAAITAADRKLHD